MSAGVRLECPAGGWLLGMLVLDSLSIETAERPHVEKNLVELSCRRCTRADPCWSPGSGVAVVHRFSLAGQFVESATLVAGCDPSGAEDAARG